MTRDARESNFYDALGCLVMRLDRKQTIRFINHSGLKLLGYERIGELFGKPLAMLFPENDPMSIDLTQRIGDESPCAVSAPFESDLLHREGFRVPIAWILNNQNKGAGEAEQTLLVGFDASTMRESRAAATMFQTVSDNFTGSILITAPDNSILYANPALLQMTGYALEELIGKTPAVFKSGQTSGEVYRNLWETIESGGIWNGEMINCRKDGSHYLEFKTIAAIRDSQRQIQFHLAIGEDGSQRQQLQQHIDRLLAFDQMTGLPNRTAFMNLLVGTLNSAAKQGRETTVLHIDIDDFFMVNDAIGANEADLVIVEIAISIKGALRQADTLARLGNDKFAILLGPHDSGFDDVIFDVSERVLAAIRCPVLFTDNPINVTASIGIAGYPVDGESASELLSHAMNATERAKSGGGNSFCRFDAQTASSASGRRELINDLRLAIERNEMFLHFQPQVSLFSGAIIGLETLIRWRHPQRGMVSPGEFIPLAEQSNLIIDIGEWVLSETLRQMRAWLDAGLPLVKVAINLAARHLLAPELHTRIGNALSLQRIDPHMLEIEITEGAMMQDVAGAIRITTLLKKVGVRLSLDDFGTGYSSLAYLSRFPIDVVKIDQSFISDITTNPVNAAIAQATIAMSHKLGKVVLAEGVETEEQMQYLRRNDCDEMQGYYFSRPLPAEDITPMLQEGLTMNLAAKRDSEPRSTVLFVDDEANILASLKRTLRREGYEILTAGSAAEGLSLLATHDIQVIVSDQRMPEMNGTEFLSRVKSLYPETVRMVLSGYSEITAVTDAINKGAVYRFMLKPWDTEMLKKEVIGALRHWRELYASRRKDDRINS